MSQAVSVATPTSLLDAVRDLAPLVKQYAAEAEEHRRLSTPVVEAFRDAGVFRMCVPKDLGGLEVDLPVSYEVFEALARLDSAVGWCMMLALSNAIFGAWLPGEGAAEIFGDPNTIVGGTLFPSAKAVPVDGGYRVTGRMPFVSLCHHCTWFGTATRSVRPVA